MVLYVIKKRNEEKMELSWKKVISKFEYVQSLSLKFLPI